MKLSLKHYLASPVTICGLIVAAVCFGASVVLLILEMFAADGNPYRSILSFFVFPSLMGMGLFVAVISTLVRRRRLKRRLYPTPAATLGGLLFRRRYLGIGALAFTGIVLLLSSLGGYRAYEFSDSTEFCGTLCHEVMEPEHVTYLNSPHARIKCVACHVGRGAKWYVKAKISGLYQIYATAADKYPRPIPTPISSLRPAQDTCEKCHWPKKFWGAQLATRVHAGFDFENSRRELMMLVKTGGGGMDHGPSNGIHWHMNISNHVEYIARDPKRLDIPWIKVTRSDGTVLVYADPQNPLTEEEKATLPARRMDCMDCHNRPTHIYLSPVRAVDRLFLTEKLDDSIPYLKREAVQVLADKYETRAEAMTKIEKNLIEGYRKRYPKIAEARSKDLVAAAEALKGIYNLNFFPNMKADWSAYPDHIGHKEFPGCFRCHSDRHATPEGAKLSKDCDLCHTFGVRSEDGRSMRHVPSDASFVHPWTEGHQEQNCWDCHTGKSSPYQSCAECHEREPEAPMKFACSVCHRPLARHSGMESVKPGAATLAPEVKECARCHDVSDSEAHAIVGHHDCSACHKPHDWAAKVPDNCKACHEKQMKGHYPDETCDECHDFSGVPSEMTPTPKPHPAKKPH